MESTKKVTQKVSVRTISPNTSLISRSGRRSALTGRYITKATVARHPRTTVTSSSEGTSRGAVTGRYVTSSKTDRDDTGTDRTRQAN